jgi:predicted kinase
MRKWMRDRMRRRKEKGKPEQGATAEPGQAPLQPTFLDRAAPVVPPSEEQETGGWESQGPGAVDERVQAEAFSASSGDEPLTESRFDEELQPGGEPAEARPPTGREAVRNGGRRDRSRRRGRGGKPRPERRTQPAREAPGRTPGSLLPFAPGQATGEAAEVDGMVGAETAAEAEAAPAPASGKSKGAVVLSIGLPGSGKSSWFKRHNIIPLSSDLIRGLLFDNPTEQRYQDLVFSSLRSLLRARLIAGRPLNYIDATNLSPRERHSWIKMAREFGYEAHAVFFDVPAEVCMERNRKRSRNVPEDVMHRMALKLRPPKFEEGFARITVVRLKRQETTGGEEPH